MLNTDFKKAIDRLQANPIACASLCFRAMEELSAGKVKIVDPSAPFPYLMETAVLLAANSLDRNVTNLQQIYPSNANNYQNLYKHMCDRDYRSRFSTPGSAPIMFFLDLDELKNKAVPVNDGSGNRKLTISRNSKIVAGGKVLTFLYPIDIVITNFNAIVVQYDTSILNPLQTIPDTIVPSELRKTDRTTYLFFEVPVMQLDITSSTFAVTGSQGLKRKLKFSDKFHYVRAFMRDDDSKWEELTVRHNPLVIDNTKVTIVANVDTVDRTIELMIPQVYKNTEMLKDNIRIDIYSTEGEINVPLFNLNDNLFKATWFDHETTQISKFAAPMSNFNGVIIASDGTITGGSNGLTFRQLRDKVVNRSIVTEGFPISFPQLATELEKSGFSTILTRDNVTDREFLATKHISEPSRYSLTTTSIGTLTTLCSATLNEMLQNKRSARDNVSQITVLPNALYEMVRGKLELVHDDEVVSLLEQRRTAIDKFVNIINDRKFYYCPYFMIHYFDRDRYITKPYRLDKPRIISKSIENENRLLDYTSSISSYNIQVDSNYQGYSIYVQINPSDTLKEQPLEDLKLQLRISDENDRSYYWFNGELVTAVDPETGRPMQDYYVYRFALPTNWGVTEDEEILIGDRKIPFKLKGTADIYTIIRKTGLGSQFKSKMDNNINPTLFDDFTITTSNAYYAIIQERVVIELGKHMAHLWRQQRPAIEESKIAKYEEDVYDVWEETQYYTDAAGDPRFSVNEDGSVTFAVKWERGSKKLDFNNKPIIVHHKGDYVKDDKGKGVPVGGERGLKRHHEIVLMDGKYYFATHDKTIEYRESVKDEIDSWMTIMETMRPELLERTTLYTHPKITEGRVRALLDGGTDTYIESAQQLSVTFTVDERVETNEEAKTSIRKTTVDVIQRIFNNNATISRSDLIKALKDALSVWVLGVDVMGFLNDEYHTVSLLDTSVSLAIPKRLSITSNLEVIVENDITIEFVTHTLLTV